ncbi:MAG: site-specific integrase, partial [Opitutaceae bacterium]
MNHQTMFAVSRFENRNGVFSFRVDGYLNGVRIRRNFKTQEEAAAEKASLELKALQMTSNLRAVT